MINSGIEIFLSGKSTNNNKNLLKKKNFKINELGNDSAKKSERKESLKSEVEEDLFEYNLKKIKLNK